LSCGAVSKRVVFIPAASIDLLYQTRAAAED